MELLEVDLSARVLVHLVECVEWAVSQVVWSLNEQTHDQPTQVHGVILCRVAVNRSCRTLGTRD